MSLIEQLGNIGSEVGRAKIAQETEDDRFQGAVKRALELFDRTLSDSRWSDRIDEIKMAKDCFVDATTNRAQKFHTTLADLDTYFMYFAMATMQQYDN